MIILITDLCLNKNQEEQYMSSNYTCHTGEKPGKGCYSCTNCGTDLRLGAEDKMPPCPHCNNTSFVKCE